MEFIEKRIRELIDEVPENLKGNKCDSTINYLLARNIVLSEDILKELKKKNNIIKPKKKITKVFKKVIFKGEDNLLE